MAGLRILLTADAVGGVWQYATELARELGRSGVETVLAVLGPEPSDAQRQDAERIPGARLVLTGQPLDWLCDGPEPVRAAGKAIAEMARRERVDLVQLNMPTLAASATFDMPVVAVTHGCVATWWAAARGTPLAPEYRWHRAMMEDGLNAADIVVAPSSAYAAIVAREYGLAEPPVAVWNGRRALADSRPAASHDCALTVGRLWDSVKNAEILDRAAARLAIPFHAAGATRGPHGETIALSHLHPLGELDAEALGRRLAARPVFVSAATFEPFGLAVLEAAAAGCPLVLSDIATFRELWDGVAVFVAPDDAEGYARAIERIIGDTMLRRSLGRSARERAARYTPEATAAAMRALYARLLEARSPAPAMEAA